MEYYNLCIPNLDLAKTHTADVLLYCVKKAICEFNARETFLIENDVGERCICGKFSMYLECVIRQVDPNHEYDVDVEYDRGYDAHENTIKRLADEETGNVKRIIPDLVVHKRKYTLPYGFINLICIEMKKNGTPSKMKSDKERLKVLTARNGQFGYTIGIMLNAKTNCGESQNGITIDAIYIDGREH